MFKKIGLILKNSLSDNDKNTLKQLLPILIKSDCTLFVEKEINLDGNFLGTINLSAEFSFQPNIRDLRLDGYVDYSESTFGEVNLEYDPEPLTFKAGETVRRSFKASWDIKEDTDNYDVELITVLDVRMEAGYHVFRMIDFCPEWKGVLPAQEINLNNEPSGGSFNLNSSFSMPLSVVSMVMAAAVLRKE